MTLRRPKQTQAECEAAISPLRALTLWPEWAYAVCHLGKNIENRQWVPPPGAIGHIICIHGGKYIGGLDTGTDRQWQAMLSLCETATKVTGKEYRISDQPGPCSVNADLINARGRGIVAVARLDNVLKHSQDHGWYRADCFGWVLEDVVVLPEPVECRGAQGLWKVKPSVAEKVLAQLKGLKDASNH